MIYPVTFTAAQLNVVIDPKNELGDDDDRATIDEIMAEASKAVMQAMAADGVMFDDDCNVTLRDSKALSAARRHPTKIIDAHDAVCLNDNDRKAHRVLDDYEIDSDDDVDYSGGHVLIALDAIAALVKQAAA